MNLNRNFEQLNFSVAEIKDLVPAIIQDYYSGQVLMLAYVNQESYDFMREKGETCFWSRSREKLWHKGETSGDFQKIKTLAFDCDNDTLLIHVEQTGKGACHLGRWSCFGSETAEYAILNEVYKQIEDRAKNPAEKSYTNYLLDKGIDKICKKLGEEITETVIAAKNKDKAELIGEIADVAYHMLVLMYTQGLKLSDINAKLAERHTVKNNLKTQNQKGEF